MRPKIVQSRDSKSRENFLRILLQGKEGYHINEAMIWHLFQSGVSDRAGQFALFDHSACWVHMERPLRKIICTSEKVVHNNDSERDIRLASTEKIQFQAASASLVDFLRKIKI